MSKYLQSYKSNKEHYNVNNMDFSQFTLVINFFAPEIPKNMKSIENPRIKGFPYQYFKREVLTDEVVEYRIRVIYINFEKIP